MSAATLEVRGESPLEESLARKGKRSKSARMRRPAPNHERLILNGDNRHLHVGNSIRKSPCGFHCQCLPLKGCLCKKPISTPIISNGANHVESCLDEEATESNPSAQQVEIQGILDNLIDTCIPGNARFLKSPSKERNGVHVDDKQQSEKSDDSTVAAITQERSRYGRLRKTKRPLSLERHVPLKKSPLTLPLPQTSKLDKVTAKTEARTKVKRLPKLKEKPKEPLSCGWNSGDVVWAKVGAHPWWPAMITVDPEQGIFAKTRGTSHSRPFFAYHVSFFGNRKGDGWVTAGSIQQFEGLQLFSAQNQGNVKSTPPNSKFPKKPTSNVVFDMPLSKRETWELAVSEAEAAMALDVLERTAVLFRTESSRTLKALQQNQVSAEGDVADCLNTIRSSMKSVNAEKESLPSSILQGILEESLKSSESGVTSNVTGSATEADKCPAVNGPQVEEDVNFSCKRSESEVMTAFDKNSDDKDIVNNSKSSQSSSKGQNRIRARKSSLKVKANTPPVQPVPCIEAIENSDAPAQKRSRRTCPEDDSNEDGVVEEDLDVIIIGEEFAVKSNLELMLPQKSAKESLHCAMDRPCPTCEKMCSSADKLVRCEGFCHNVFHVECLKLDSAPVQGFKCDECASDFHMCFACKKSALRQDLKRCTIVRCGKFYHEECLIPMRGYRCDKKALTCPLHNCLSCAITSLCSTSTKSRLCRCFKCPVAYHLNDACLAAGSVVLSPTTIVCPKHFEPRKKSKPHRHVNVNWCFVCSQGGSLICCEACPASFHVECLQIEPPDGGFYCEDCKMGSQPKYGDIVWVKLGTFRWWPAEICNPRIIPQNILNLPHQTGQFPVRFYGTHDYYWTNKSRVFHFIEGDHVGKERGRNSLDKPFSAALQEAIESYRTRKHAMEIRYKLFRSKTAKPPVYRHIKTNKPVGGVQVFMYEPSQLTPCECDPNTPNPCSSDSDCLNRMLMFECNPGICRAKDKCRNQRFQKRLYPPVETFETEERGWGLKTLVDIKKGDFVCEYVGELINEEECRRRIDRMHSENDSNFYFLTVDKDRIIDAGPKGNLARFMNHSCQPNCETQKWAVNGVTRVGLFALCDIKQGAELTFNYNLECLGSEKKLCRCGSENCSGYIGDRPKNSNNTSNVEKQKGKRGRKPKVRDQGPAHEDECFRCGDGGELVLCDRKNCLKAYHPGCLNRTDPPPGAWVCPWHHCDTCGKLATSFCSICPNSFCKRHNEGTIHVLDDGQHVCNEHDIVLMKTILKSPKMPSSNTDVDNTEKKSSENNTDVRQIKKETVSRKPRKRTCKKSPEGESYNKAKQSKFLHGTNNSPDTVPGNKRVKVKTEQERQLDENVSNSLYEAFCQ